MATYRAKYTAQLPPTPCTPEMREQVIAKAKEGQKSMAEVQRDALEFFLSRNVTEANNIESGSIITPAGVGQGVNGQ